ncbi:MAG TPA: hypothetical protein GX746_07890 [Bacteroidales bacterium]|nr:hypothetical protein [Bacteroidales bacterium]
MKKYLFILLSLSLVMFGCEEDDPKSVAVVSTANVTDITQTTATSGGNVTNDGGAAVTSRGVCWGTTQTPTINDSKTASGDGLGSFTSSIIGLQANTTYYVRAYASNSEGVSYGNAISFKTLKAIGLATLTTVEVAEITTTTAVSGGNITDDGGAAVTARGVCWSTSESPTINDYKTEDGEGLGEFASNLTELELGTTYYVRAYAVNSEGVAYGNEQIFETLAELPTVTTASLTNATATSVDTGGEITSDGGAAITARGVCYGTEPNPTIDGLKTSDGTGAGVFESSLTDLTPRVTYYIRAYATNSVGTAYGNELRYNGLTEDINEFLPEEILDEIKDLGLTIHTGTTPPNIEGVYSLSPQVLKNSNRPYDVIGQRYADSRIQISSQDNSKLTASFESVELDFEGNVISSSIGDDGYIAYLVGDESNFSLFIRVVSTRTTGESAELVYAYSGIIGEDSIESLHLVLIMVDNNGRDDIFIANGEGRLFYDEDGVSERIPSLLNVVPNTKDVSGVKLPSSISK